MARRSYLQRIAEPLLPGQPVLFPLSRAAPDEARPAVAVSPPTPGVAQDVPKSLRRAPASAARAVQAMPGLAPAAPAAAQSGAPTLKPAAEPAAVAEAGPPAPILRADPLTAAGPETRAALEESAPTGEGDTGAQRLFDTAAPSTSIVTALASPSVPAPRAVAVATSSAAAVPDAAPTAVRSVLPAAAADAPERPPPTVAMPPADAAAERTRTAPSIHIGTIEVRTAAPALPAPAAPPAAIPSVPRAAPADAAPARGYGWRFGLIQG